MSINSSYFNLFGSNNQVKTTPAASQGYSTGENPARLLSQNVSKPQGGYEYKPVSTEDMELANKIAMGSIFGEGKDVKTSQTGFQGREESPSIDGESIATNPFATSGASSLTPSGLEGAAYQGFAVPENNGTGQLQPDSRDEIRGKELYCLG